MLRTLCFVVAASLLAHAAAAIDLTGTWQETKPAHCKLLNSLGVKSSDNDHLFFPQGLAISQSGAVVTAHAATYEFEGYVQSDAKKDIGQGGLELCSGAVNFVRSLYIRSARVKDATHASIRAEARTAALTGVFTCTLELERVDAADPSAPGCP